MARIVHVNTTPVCLTIHMTPPKQIFFTVLCIVPGATDGAAKLKDADAMAFLEQLPPGGQTPSPGADHSLEEHIMGLEILANYFQYAALSNKPAAPSQAFKP